jgi:hypothetical protein
MRTAVIRLAGGVLVATGPLLVLVIAFPGKRTTFFSVYALVLGVMAVGALIGAFRSLRPAAWERSPLDQVPEKSERPLTIDELARIDRLVVLGCASSFDLHYRLRPLLRELAAERLHVRHGIVLGREPERARQLLGEEFWEVVRPGRELGQRRGAGLPQAALAGFVDRLEEL